MHVPARSTTKALVLCAQGDNYSLSYVGLGGQIGHAILGVGTGLGAGELLAATVG